MDNRITDGAERAPGIGALTARLLAVVALAAQPMAAHAQRVAAAPARSVMSLDVAGVRLGMAKAQTDAALAAAFYRCEAFGTEGTFAERVEAEVTRRRGKPVPWGQVGSGPSETNCTGPNGEAMKIEWAQAKSGPVVHTLRLIIDPKRIDQQALLAQVLAKLGLPTIGTVMDGSWCDPGYECHGGPLFCEGPVIMVNSQNGLDIMAGRGERVRHAEDAAVIAEATRLVPAQSRAAF